jgi:hypothetical protein
MRNGVFCAVRAEMLSAGQFVSQLRVNSWVNEFVRQSPAAKNVSTEAEGIVGIRNQATAGEDITN